MSEPARHATSQPMTGAPGRITGDGGNDAELISRSVGTPECFAGLFDRHAPAIHGYIARRLGHDSADDLLAQTFLVAFGRRDRYDTGQADARPWLYGIATNLVRRHRRDEVRFYRAIARTGIDPAAEPVADQVAERVAAQAVRGQLAAALAGLSAADRDVLLLVTDGFGYAEIAQALGIPAGTVASRLSRARKKVRDALGGANPAEPRMEPAGG
jgi:RNA polymerase sigma factor (sigma-70 family)